MKQLSFRTFTIAAALYTVVCINACKSKDTNTNAEKNDTSSTYMEPKQDNTTVKPDTAQVMISSDDSLTGMAKDAVKDYPGVTATVNDGVVTLSGDITRAKLPKLMMAIQSTHPKKVINNLTIK